LLNSEGGDRLKFSNVIIATVSLVLLGFILEVFFLVGFIPMNNDMLADMLSFIIASLISSLIVGYVFAPSIQEDSRIKPVGVVTFSLPYQSSTSLSCSNPPCNKAMTMKKVVIEVF